MDTNSASLFHPKIAKLYKIEQQILTTNKNSFIKKEGIFNCKTLEELLVNNGGILRNDSDPIFPKTYDEYLPHVQHLHPLFIESESVLSRVVSNTDWLKKLQWLGQQSRLPIVLHEHCQPSSTISSVENVLFITSALENALGNVYQTVAKKAPPHLLRDLLDTKELRDALGICPIFFLKILMGSPESINLRNIVWHGFPLPQEIHSCFVSALLIASASLGDLISQIPVTKRQQVNDFSRFLSKIQSSSIDFAVVDKRVKVMNTIDSSQWTGQWASYWKRIYQHYEQQNYWRFVLLIPPQIELVLRKMYGEANNFNISAKLHEYYITMNNIFDSSDDNRLLDSYLSKETFHFLYDIFISPFGMRIRDKVSHGEVDLDCIDRELCSVLLYAGLNLLNRQEFPLEKYESKFHLNCLTHQAIAVSKTCVLELTNMATPTSLKIDFNWNLEAVKTLQQLKIVKSVDIFHRPKKEPEIMTNLMKIAQLIVQVCQNYKMSFEERFGMLVNHELRSRARKTLEKMVESVGVVAETLATIISCLVAIINTKGYENRFETYQRFCKQTLTIVENLVHFSDRESNEWLKALDCCSKFRQIKLNLDSKCTFS